MAEVEQPIIIKKVYKLDGGHHGGAWKVAYADFVTAMMAFFLLLWLISSASESTLDGLAEFFTPTVGIKDSAGIGFKGGEAPTDIGTKKDNKTPPGIIVGMQPQGPIPGDPKKEALIESTEDANLFEKAQEQIKQAFEENPNLQEFRDNIIVEQTPEGLKLELMDSDRQSMFIGGTLELSDYGKEVLKRMKPLIEIMPNHISITGHTDATPFPPGSKLSNWDLSTGRANSARRYLIEQGLEGERPVKIVGLADRELLLPQEPKSPRNRRITIILLRGSHMNLLESYRPGPRELLSAPNTTNVLEKERAKQQETAPVQQKLPDQGVFDSISPKQPAITDPQYKQAPAGSNSDH